MWKQWKSYADNVSFFELKSAGEISLEQDRMKLEVKKV